jgi:hypothetical protein
VSVWLQSFANFAIFCAGPVLNSFRKAHGCAEEDAQKAAKDAKRGITPRDLLCGSSGWIHASKGRNRAEEDAQKTANDAKIGIAPVGR